METFTPHIDRRPIAAGRFYSGDAESLEIEIKELIQDAESLKLIKLPLNSHLLALVAPHAGYVYSGIVAASAFKLLKEIEPRKKVFLIGSSHHTDFNGASVYNKGNYITPFGPVSVDEALADELISGSSIFEFVQAAHAHEHCLEVMLPFIQYFWNSDFEIVPIILATHRKDICEKVAEKLLPYFTRKNLFIFSTDLSHYPQYSDAVKVDRKTVNAVLTGLPDDLLLQIEQNKKEHIPNLATSMCGWTSVLVMLYLMQSIKNAKIYPILYQNSGDASLYGEKDRVVGYQSLALYDIVNENIFSLSQKEKDTLLDVAKESIRFYLENGDRFMPDISLYNEKLKSVCGAFVSIYLEGELNGCIGRIKSVEAPLVSVISDIAVSAAFYDNRYTPLNKDNFDDIEIEISVLSPLQEISSPDDIIVGKHGIYIQKDNYSGTFLPQVGARTNWSVEELLGRCSRDKAHLGWDGWKDAEIFTYEAIVFRG